MADRRPLVEGLKPKPEGERTLEEQFVFGGSKQLAGGSLAPREAAPAKHPSSVGRVNLTTRVRADLAQALKRASLERQLQGVEPYTVQDILEGMLEPWLKANGYLA